MMDQLVVLYNCLCREKLATTQDRWHLLGQQEDTVGWWPERGC